MILRTKIEKMNKLMKKCENDERILHEIDERKVKNQVLILENRKVLIIVDNMILLSDEKLKRIIKRKIDIN
jgi:hypothetical protein